MSQSNNTRFLILAVLTLMCQGCGGDEATLSPEPEICDGVDNDFSGEADEPFQLGEGCSIGTGLCRTNGVWECNPETGGRLCNARVELPKSELCDGLDNDCDGEADDGFDVGAACSVGTGDCSTVGTLTCSADGSSTTCAATPGVPNDETCDERDNDCDGQTDEGLLNACGSCGRVPVETCDGADNDCDGATDEGVTNACGDCGSVRQEVCDGDDNDCDGRTDEGVRNACGECGAEVEEACDGRDNDCDNRIDEGVLNDCGNCGEPPREVCDGFDNDCDSSVDEGVLNACGRCGMVPPELCDELDNDCDGSADENFQSKGDDCVTGVGACAQTGVVACERSGGVTCTAVPSLPSREDCDGQDNDCDGTTDEGFQVGQACQIGYGLCGTEGTIACDRSNGGAMCVPPNRIEPSADVCDTADNDCDGRSDEGCYVRVEPGSFMMGSPANELGRDADEILHEVRLSLPIEVKRTEVTELEFASVTGFFPIYTTCDSCPAIVRSRLGSFDSDRITEVVAYLNGLSDLAGFDRCYDDNSNFSGVQCEGYRLATEAEWERIARSGTETAYYSGDSCGFNPGQCLDLNRAAWYGANSNQEFQPVAGKEPNDWGLFDMLGNAAEWVNDEYDAYPRGLVVDPYVNRFGLATQIVRGGSVFSDSWQCRAAYRDGVCFSCGAGQDYYEAGIRVVRTLPLNAPPARFACLDGLDNDGDGRIDAADRGCWNEQDNNEDDRLP